MTITLKHRVENAAIRALLAIILAIPYRWRIPAMGWIATRIVAPLTGWRKRIRENLAHACPELSPSEVERLVRQVPDNAGRSLIEIYSGREFTARVQHTPLRGPGVSALRDAQKNGRPAIVVTGHFGNYDAPRAALFAQGFPLAALYREMKNPKFNAHYVRAISEIGAPVFPATRVGISAYIAHLAKGGLVGILNDVHASKGAMLTFFGKPAPTAISVAQWALKYDAALIPIYGIRAENGLDFDIWLDQPITPSTPEEMSQRINDSLEQMVRAHMAQWFWIHRRWKPERQRAQAAATSEPGPSS